MTGTGQTQQLTSGVQFNAKYAFSAKTSFNASLQFFRQKQDVTNAVVGIDSTRNQITNLVLGATWTPSRAWQFNCGLTLNDRNQSRSSSQPITLLPYTAYGGSCSAQLVLQ